MQSKTIKKYGNTDNKIHMKSKRIKRFRNIENATIESNKIQVKLHVFLQANIYIEAQGNIVNDKPVSQEIA